MRYSPQVKRLADVDNYLIVLCKITGKPILLMDKNGYLVLSIYNSRHGSVYIYEHIPINQVMNRWREISNFSKGNLKLNCEYDSYEVELPWKLM